MSILDGPFTNSKKTLRMVSRMAEQLVKGEVLEQFPVLKRVLEGRSLGQALELPKFVLDALHHKAVKLAEAGHYGRARDFYLILGQFDPMDERYVYGTAFTFQAEGNFRSAAQFYQYYLAFTVDRPVAYLRLGECLLGAGEIDTAAEFFIHARELAEELGDSASARYARKMADRCQNLTQIAQPARPLAQGMQGAT